jgi:hypothetical protein
MPLWKWHVGGPHFFSPPIGFFYSIASVIERFDCFYCGTPNQAEEHLIGCVINCAACGRSIVVPQSGLRPPPRALLIRRGQTVAAASGFALGGGLFLGAPSLLIGWYAQNQFVGITLVHAIGAGIGAFALGSVIGATIGWRLSAN